MRHSRVISNLYEYIAGTLSAVEKELIDEHLADCVRCSRELADMRQVLQNIPSGIANPSARRPEMYWQHFAGRVEQRIESEPTVEGRSIDKILNWFGHRRSFVLGFGTAVAVIAVAITAWQLLTFQSSQELPLLRPEGNAVSQIQPASLETRTQDYLERSKILLVGMLNTEIDAIPKSEAAFRKQREISRDLVRESRHLTAALNGPSQQRLRRLVSDLELILIQLANIEAQDDSPAIDLIKSGVERRNILLKINLEELQRTAAVKEEFKTVRQRS